jgi:hypothetical protein
LHLAESKPPLSLAYINPATPLTYDVWKRAAAFFSRTTPTPITEEEVKFPQLQKSASAISLEANRVTDLDERKLSLEEARNEGMRNRGKEDKCLRRHGGTFAAQRG